MYIKIANSLKATPDLAIVRKISGHSMGILKASL